MTVRTPAVGSNDLRCLRHGVFNRFPDADSRCQKLEGQLLTTAFATSCFDDATIEDYADCRLAAARSDAVDEHLSHCGRRQAVLVRIADKRTPPDWIQQYHLIRQKAIICSPADQKTVILSLGFEQSAQLIDTISQSLDVSRSIGSRSIDFDQDPNLPLQIGRFQIRRLIGVGGIGIVYEAWDPQLERRVAIKRLRSALDSNDRRDRLKREATALARLSHPNIVAVFEVDELSEHPYLAMEFVAGGSLASLVDRKPIDPRVAANLMVEIATGLAAAHAQGVVHRDLKPVNILMQTFGEPGGSAVRAESPCGIAALVANARPQIADFGLARVIDHRSMTHDGDVLGTPVYMAPEQAAGRTADVGPAADIYSLGAILYELLTGRPPLVADDVLQTLQLVRTAEPVSPQQLQPGIPLDLETITLKCLRKEAALRYATADALADDLRAFLDGRSVLARPLGRTARLWRWCRRNPLTSFLIALAAVLLLGLAVGGIVFASVQSGLRQQAEGNLDRAKASERRTEQNLVAALDAISNYAATLNDFGAPGGPGAEQVRDRLRSQMRDWHEGYLTQLGAPETWSAVDVRAAYQYVRLSADLRQDQSAAKWIPVIFAATERLHQLAPSDLDHISTLAHVYALQATLVGEDRPEELERLISLAVDHRRVCLAAEPGNFNYASALSIQLANLGYVQTHFLKAFEAAHATLSEGVRVQRKCCELARGAESEVLTLADGLVSLALVEVEQAHAEAARTTLQASSEALQQLASNAAYAQAIQHRTEKIAALQTRLAEMNP